MRGWRVHDGAGSSTFLTWARRPILAVSRAMVALRPSSHTGWPLTSSSFCAAALGFNLSLIDFNKYAFLLILLLQQQQQTHGRSPFTAYALLFLLAVGLNIPVTALASRLIDAASSRRCFRVLQFLSLLQTALLCGLFVTVKGQEHPLEQQESIDFHSPRTDTEILAALFVAGYMVMSVVALLLWKLTKLATDGMPLEQENIETARIGNISDIVADGAETVAIGILLLLSLLWWLLSMDGVQIFLGRQPPVRQSRAQQQQLLRMLALGGVLVQAAFSIGTLVFASLFMRSLFPVWRPTEDSHRDLADGNGDASVDVGLGSQFRYLWKQADVRHSFLHGLLTMALYNIAEYPLAFREDAEAGGDVEAAATLGSGQGHGAATDAALSLLQRGLVVNVVFFAASCIYQRTMVRLSPAVFFRRRFQVLLAILLAALGILFVLGLLPPGTDLSSGRNRGPAADALSAGRQQQSVLQMLLDTVRILSMAVVQVLPYYLSAYDYYVMCALTRSRSVGFVTAIYNVGVQLIYVLVFLATGVIEVSASATLWTAIALVAVSAMYTNRWVRPCLEAVVLDDMSAAALNGSRVVLSTGRGAVPY